MRVVIAGGGVAGLTAGALLSRTGAHEVVVCERAPAYTDVGYGIGLYPLGASTFHALGRYDALRDRSTPLRRYAVHGPDGALLQSVDLAELLARFGPMLGVSRADLIDVLAGCLPPGSIRFGCEVTAARLEGAEVVVSTSSGEVTGDVVVAADGMGSALRQSVFGSVPMESTGYDAWMWWAAEGSTPSDTASEY